VVLRAIQDQWGLLVKKVQQVPLVLVVNQGLQVLLVPTDLKVSRVSPGLKENKVLVVRWVV
jgi:hypothetical protein